MRKYIAIVLSFVMLFSLAACGVQENHSGNSQSQLDQSQTENTQKETENTTKQTEDTTEQETTTNESANKQDDTIRPEFKEAMDAYEAFYDEYCKFMAEYKKNPTDLSLLGKYAEMLTKLDEMNKAFEAWDEDEMSTAELKYYLDVNNRVMQKMIDVAG